MTRRPSLSKAGISQTRNRTAEEGMESESNPTVATNELIARAPEAVGEPAKKQGRNLTSEVWKVFERPVRADGVFVNKVICSYCQVEYEHKGGNPGTSTLKNHLKRCKKNPNNVVSNCQTTPDIAFAKPSDKVVWKFDAKLARKAFAKMIIMDELPFKFVEREGFQYFMSVVQPSFKLLSRTTVAKDCLQVYQVEERLDELEQLESALLKALVRDQISDEMMADN